MRWWVALWRSPLACIWSGSSRRRLTIGRSISTATAEAYASPDTVAAYTVAATGSSSGSMPASGQLVAHSASREPVAALVPIQSRGDRAPAGSRRAVRDQLEPAWELRAAQPRLVRWGDPGSLAAIERHVRMASVGARPSGGSPPPAPFPAVRGEPARSVRTPSADTNPRIRTWGRRAICISAMCPVMAQYGTVTGFYI